VAGWKKAFVRNLAAVAQGLARVPAESIAA
jgi:hypothetical protein